MNKNIHTHSTLLKAKILSHGYQITSEAEELIDDKIKEAHWGYGDSHLGAKKTTKIPCELMLPGEIVVATHIRPHSPLKLDVVNNKLVMLENDKIFSEVNYLERPRIWSKHTKDGVNMKKIANFYGRDCLNFNIYSGCEFWDVKMPCKFCSVKPTQVRHGEVLLKKSAEQIAEVTKEAFKLENKIDFILVTGGSALDGDKEIGMITNVLSKISQEIPKSWNGVIKGNAALMVPQNIEKIDQLMETGIEHPAFNLEVWGKSYFANICPGKAKYRGWDHIMETYKYAVSKYGRGRFWVNFVGGLNTLEELQEGFTFMAEMGVVPGANIFHPDLGSYLGAHENSPSEDYIINLYKHAAKLYHKFDYQPFFNEKVLRNSLANEAFLGYI